MEETKMIVMFNYNEISCEISCEGEEYQMIKELAEYYTNIPLMNVGNAETQRFPIPLNVGEIDGLTCNPFLLIDSYLHYETKVRLYRIYFEVKSLNLYHDEEDCSSYSYYIKKILNEQDTPLTYIEFMKVFIISKYLLSNLKYCHTDNGLNLTPQNKTDLIRRIFGNILNKHLFIG